MTEHPSHPHVHKDEEGKLVACYHKCVSIARQPEFWILTTFTFPFEHFLWWHVPPFTWLTKLMGH